eukprot:Rhum_TRINITY_DN14427_c8_g1::Rhum_TRINITY_DN14427_c8_g1_i1::g.89871::m.89871
MAEVERLKALAETHRAHGRCCESLRTYEKVFLIQRRLGSRTLDVAETYSSISAVYADQSKYQDALSCLSKAIDLCQTLAPGSSSLAALYVKRGDIFREWKSIEEALRWYTKAHALLLTAAPDSAARAELCVTIGGLFRPRNATKCRVEQRSPDTLTVLGDFEPECSNSERLSSDSGGSDDEWRNNINLERTGGLLRRRHRGIGDADDWAILWWSKAFLICEDQKLGTRADVGLQIGFAHYDRGEDDDAESWWNRALEIQKNLLGPESLDVADMLQSIYAYCEAAELKTPLLEEAAEIERKQVPNSSRLSQTLSAIGNAMTGTLGLRYLEEACKIDVALRPEDAAATQIDFAALCEDDGEYDMALRWLLPASELQEKAGSAELADTLATIGNVYRELGDDTAALKWLKKCCEVQEPNSPELALTCHRIGTLLHKTPEEALRWHHKAQAMQEEHDAYSADLADTYESLSDVYGSQGLLRERVRYLKKRCVVLENSELDDPAELSLLYTSIGDTYEKLGDSAEASRWKLRAEEALDGVEDCEESDYDDDEYYGEDYTALEQEYDEIYGGFGYDPYNKD